MKMYAKAKIVTKAAVTSKLASFGDTYVNGMIFVEIPELGFETPNLILCRYGLSVPVAKIEVDQALWVEPTIGTSERFIYTGFADGVTDAFNSDNAAMLYLSTLVYILLKSNGDIEIKSGSVPLEKMVLGETLQTQLNILKASFSALVGKVNDLITSYNAHKHGYVSPGGPALSDPILSGASSSSDTTANFTTILSAKVKNN